MIDVELLGGIRSVTDSFLGLALTTNEQDLFTGRGELRKKLSSGIELFDGFIEVDQVDVMLFSEEKLAHLRVPLAGLVAEMDTSFDEFSNEFVGHVLSRAFLQATEMGWRAHLFISPILSNRCISGYFIDGREGWH